MADVARRLFHSYLNETKKKINFQFLKLIFLHELLIKLTLSVVIYAIFVGFNHPVARKDLGRIQKNESASCVTDRSVVLIEPKRHCKSLNEKPAEEKY